MLGRGSVAEVYLASDLRLGGLICLKALLPHLRTDKTVRSRFETEVAAVRGLDHPNIVRVFELLEDGPILYFTLQHLAGGDLKRHMRRSGPLSPEAAVPIAAAVAAALSAAHAQGVVHRDVKPQNILLGESGQVKLADFGLARMVSLVGVSMGSMAVGTPLYAAPELLSGSVLDPRADLYSLGVVLFEMLTGRLPFQSASFYDLLRRQVEEPAPLLRSFRPELPRWLEQAVATVLSKDPEERFQTAEEMRGALLGGAEATMQTSGLPAALPQAGGERAACPRCRTALLPFVALCLECGHEPLALRTDSRGSYLLQLRGGHGWAGSAQSAGHGRDPLTYQQKWRLVGLLQELSGTAHVPVEEMDQRLRSLPTVLFNHLSLEAGLALQRRFDEIDVPTSIRHRLSPLNLGLVADGGHIASVLAMLMVSFVFFLSLPYFDFGLTFGVALAALGAGLALRIGTFRPLAELPRHTPFVDGAPVLAERCRQVLPRLQSTRLRKLMRKILARYAELHARIAGLEGSAVVTQLRPELPTLDELGHRALALAERIQAVEDALAGLREAEFVEAIQTLELAIDEELDPQSVDRMLAERAAHLRNLDGLREGERTLSALYGDLIRLATVLAGLLGRLGSVEGRLELSRPELPSLLARLESGVGHAADALDAIAPPLPTR